MTGAITSLASRRPGPLLARGARRGGSLFAVMVVLSVAASLMLIGVAAAGRAGEAWRGRLVGSATVVVRATGLESADAAAARATEALQAMTGVARAWPLDAAPSDRWIARLADPDSPLGGEPRLVAVAFKPASAAGAAEISRALRADGLDARVDDHGPCTSPVLRAAGLAGLVAAALMAALMVSLAALARVATRRRLAAQREIVDLLRLAGARDGFIGRLFWTRAAAAAALAGAIGAVVAMVAAAAWRLWRPGSAPSLGADFAAAAWPLVAASIGAVCAGRAVTAHLKGAP